MLIGKAKAPPRHAPCPSDPHHWYHAEIGYAIRWRLASAQVIGFAIMGVMTTFSPVAAPTVQYSCFACEIFLNLLLKFNDLFTVVHIMGENYIEYWVSDNCQLLEKIHSQASHTSRLKSVQGLAYNFLTQKPYHKKAYHNWTCKCEQHRDTDTNAWMK